MIDHSAVERFGGTDQPPRRSAIGGARPAVAAWMVVREQNCGASALRRIGDDRSDREIDACRVAAVPGQVQAIGPVIEMRDPDRFLGRIALSEASSEQAPRGLRPAELERQFGTPASHCPEVSDARDASG